MSKILANEIANFGDDSPIDLKEGLNIPAGKPIQAAGSTGSSGQVLSTTGSTVQWITPFSGSYTDLSNKPSIPAAQVNADWNATSGLGVILNKPVVPAQPSVTTASAGTAALAYNTANGEFTFTPPDLSSFATETYVTTRGYLTSFTETDPVFSASPASNITNTKITNWDTAHGWGDHSQVGYLTLESDTLQSVVTRGNTSTSPAYFTAKLQYSNAFAAADITSSLATTYDGFFLKNNTDGNAYYSHNTAWKKLLNEDSILDNLSDVDLSVAPTNGQVLKWNGTKWAPANDLTGGGGGGLALTDLSVQSQTASGGGSLVYNNGSGVFTYTPPDLSSYITSLGDAIRDADFASNGIMKRSGAGVYTSITDNSANWDTSFTWGDHSTAGYLTSLPQHGLGVHTGVTLTSEQAGQLLQYNGTQWVNWTPNYLTAETDTFQSVVTRGKTVTSDVHFGDYSGGTGAPKIQYNDANDLLWFKHGGDNSAKIWVGNGNSFNNLQIMNTSSEAQILAQNTNLLIGSSLLNTADVYIQSANDIILGNATIYPAIKVLRNGATNGSAQSVELHWGSTSSAGNTGGKKLETTSTGVTITGALTAGGLTYPTVNGTNGQVLTSDGAGNVAWGVGGGGGASVTISDTPPAASTGDLWWESDSGRLKIYYQDVDSAQWVDVAPPLAPALSSNAPATASSTGSAGDIRYDSGYVYICVATDTWKRAALTTW